MQTRIIKADKNNIGAVADAASALSRGELVAFPTETVYGLGANALDDAAVKSIFKAKGRPSDNPLIVHICGSADADRIAADISGTARKLFDAFSPGPITLIMKKQPYISGAVTAGLDTVAVRIPSHPVARELIRLSGVPVAAPSANLSGKPSPTEAKHVIRDMYGRIAYIIDGGACSVGLESTVVDVTGEAPVILRPGGITLEALRSVVPETTYGAARGMSEDEKPKCPGMKYTHYSPDAEVVVVEGEPDAVRAEITRLVQKARAEGKKTGAMLKGGAGDGCGADIVFYTGVSGAEYASKLFTYLRGFDDAGADIIFAEFKDCGGIDEAVKNRLYKSAGNHVIRV